MSNDAILKKWNNTDKKYPLDKCLHEHIEEQAAQNPDKPALLFGDKRLSFADLNDRSNQCARYLRELGTGPDSIVGVLMERSFEMVTALLGILKAGGAYLPLDPTYPDERLRFMLDDAGVSIVLTQDKHKNTVGEFEGTVFSLDSEWGHLSAESGRNLENITTPENLAYVIYTSGSTGKPKGCMLPHKAICNRLLWMQDTYRLSEQDAVLQKTPYTFDVSVWEFFWPLLTGARLVMAKPDGHKDNNYLIDIIRKERITTCHFVPSMLRFFVSNPNMAACDFLRQVFTSGEALPYDLAMEFMKKLPAKLHNLYGPTEAAVDVTYWECEERKDKKVPIGRPISNIQIHILDSDLNNVPVGQEGELHIAGIGLARGYLNRPELTAEKFIHNQFSTEPGAKLYKTGDKARYLPDGNIEYLGRMDFQVKLRGNRIELGEIEAVLRDHEAVEEAVVMVRDETSNDPKLVAYVVPKGDPPSSRQIREFIKRKLPDYMVPNIIVPLDSIPVTLHGKLDRKALPWPITEEARENKKIEKAKPEARIRESVSTRLLQWFKEALSSPELNENDDLFDAGATSLTMVQIVEKIQKTYNVSVPVEVFLDDPTTAAITEYVSQNIARDPGAGDGEKKPDGENEPQPDLERKESQRAISDSETVIPLKNVAFKEAAYVTGAMRRNYIQKTISFNLFSRLLSLLKQESIRGNPKYLYPSAGGLNAVQTYLSVKENAVEGVKAGVYYYHPVEHALYRIDDANIIDRSIFFEYDRPVFDNAGLALFFISQLDAIMPVYHEASPGLVALDAGYMGQLILSRQADCNLGFCPVGGVDFDRISASFKLDKGHRFIHCLLGGVSDGLPAESIDNGPAHFLQKTGKGVTEHLQSHAGERTFASSLNFDSIVRFERGAFLTKEEQDQFHAKHMNIRRFSGNEAVIALDKNPIQESDYLLRSSQRDYLQKQVPFDQFSKFLALLKQERKEGKALYLYPSVSGTYAIEAYLYIKENGVEGMAEGVYYYHPVKHVLVGITAKPSKIVKTSYTPFNRKQYQKSAFCLFLIGQMNVMKPIYQDDSMYFALLEAGYIGQLLMDKQVEFDMGVCPIGGLNFDRIRPDFKLDDGHMLLHSFTCGSFEQEIPEDRVFLEVNRGKAETKVKNAVRADEKGPALRHDIAIVGISGRYPGAKSIEDYWDNLRQGKSCISELPESRKKLWGHDRSHAGSGLSVSSRGGYLDDIDCFDSLLFNISPLEARIMDPQERLFMEVVWECLENAGYTAENLPRSSQRVGVFIGAMWNDYQNQGASSNENTPLVLASSIHSSIANRISYFYDFDGPSVAINTSCSSAITAVHFACESIKRGECDAAVIGGVNLITHPYHQELLAGLDLLSKDGECRPLGTGTTGWLPGEGVGAILLKPIEDAVRDRDHIHGVIKGTAIGHSGRTARFGAPNPAMQAESIRKTIEGSGISAQSISYIELAAAGAGIADASEMEAIKKAFQGQVTCSSPRLVGSVKANIGHLESASAVSQMTKVLLQMKHRQIAPTLNFTPLNPLIQLEGSGFEVANELKIWRDGNQKDTDRASFPLRALINAFGATGSGGHIIIEEYVRENIERKGASKPTIIPISAETKGQLKELVSRLYSCLAGSDDVTTRVSDIGYTLQMGRVEMDERLAIVAETTLRLKEKLGLFLQGEEKIAGLFRGTVPAAGKGLKIDREAKDLFLIASEWVRGAAVEWSGLNDGTEGRIPLPTYPFAKERHWVRQYPEVRAGRTDSANEAGQQPVSLRPLEKDHRITIGENIPLLKIEDYLRKVLSEVSEIPVSKINARTALEKYGINSLMITKSTNRLEKDFGELPKTLFFEYQTIHELAKYFSEYHQERSKALLDYSGPLVSTAGGRGLDITDRSKPISSCFSQEKGTMDIAVIGLSGRYPKGRTIAEYWNNLKNGIDCVTEIPAERWDYRQYYAPEKGAPGKMYCKWGGFIDDVDKFDPLFFNISPREAEIMDPQERLFLETVWHTFEDAGYNRHLLAEMFDGKIGVFVGVMYGEYQLFNEQNGNGNGKLLGVSSYGSIANRVSYIFDLHGPSMAIDTLCSSSLTALHLAAESIRRGECEAAIAGGVSLSLHPHKYIAQSQLTMSSTDGRCRSFGEGGDGFVPGEGVGAVLLKPLSRAVQDHDQIYGIIRASSVNHGGRTNGYTVPNPAAQCNLISKALKRAGINPRTISYVEAHGTGTSLGDPIEIAGLSKAFGEYTNDKQYCSIGSVKSNIGHLESAAGIAGLTKIILQMKYKQLAPSLHSKQLNGNIHFEQTPFFVQRELSDWNQPVVEIDDKLETCPRRASLSSFGAGGANAHIVIEEYIPGDREPLSIPITPQNPAIIVLSAKNGERLKEQAGQLLAAIQTRQFSDEALSDMAYTLQAGREPMEERLAVIVSSVKELEQKLKDFAEDQDGIEDLYRGQVKRNNEALSVFEADEDLQKAIDAWITKGKFAKLLDLWVKGLIFDWNKLYGDTKPRRISLPTYPFAKERYWISESAPNSDNSTAATSTGTAHLSPGSKRAAISPKPTEVSLSALSGDRIQSSKPAGQASQPVTASSPGILLSEQVVNDEPKFTTSDQLPLSPESLHEELSTSLAEILHMKRSDVDIDKQFVDMGLDSITGVQWIQAVNNRYGTLINATKVYNYPTIREFSGFLAKEMNKRDSQDLNRPAIADPRRSSSEISSRAMVSPSREATIDPKVLTPRPIAAGENNHGETGTETDTGTRAVVDFREIEPDIVQVTMQDRVNKNTFSEGLLSGLITTFEAIQANSSYKVVILTGFDNYFASGGTKEALLAIYEGKVKFTDINIYSLALDCKIPVIAAMQGHAIGAGWSMGMFSDFIVMGRESVYASNYMTYGFTPGAGATLIFPEKFGLALAQEILFTGKQFFGSELESKGVPFPILPRKQVLSYAIQLAKELSASPRESLIALKDLMARSIREKVSRTYESELKMHERTFVNQPEVKERIQSLYGQLSEGDKNPEIKGSAADKEKEVRIGSAERDTPSKSFKKNVDIPPQQALQNSIAVIGMSGQFPRSRNVAEFWDNLAQGKDCISEIPSTRWSLDHYYDPDPEAAGKTYCKWMGILEDVDKFDPLFFNISPIEAVWMDPQQRLFLENCWHCIEDAGLSPSSLSGSRCSVFVGCAAGDYSRPINENGLHAQGFTGGALSILSARISYLLNLKGPCLAIDTACSSSLAAIAEACNSLILRTSDLALAGGVYAMAGPSLHIMTSKAGMLSRDGRCFTFDNRANGFVPGEGVGVILLKRLSDAIREQDPIYGVIRGWGINQDGKTNGITAPNVDSQIVLEQETYQRAGINPETISLVEAHGTGTKLGDPIEVEALTESFRSFTGKKNYCALGSAKSNIGHLLTAAGIAGVIKVLLALQHRMLPPTIHFEKLNEHISLDNSPFYINTKLQPWDVDPGIPRRACVSSFGFSGTNAHMVIEEYVPENGAVKTPVFINEKNPILFVLSTKNREQLKIYAERIKGYIKSHEDLDLADMAYTLQVGRDAMDYRLAFSADSRDDLLKALDRFVDNDPPAGVFFGQVNKSGDGATIFEADEDVNALLQKWIQKRKFKKLAELWVKGLNIDWKTLYSDAKPRRISLPAYPFVRERYWVPEVREQGSGVRSQESENKSPIIHHRVQRNTSDIFQHGETVQHLSEPITSNESNILNVSDKPRGISLRSLSDDHILASEPSGQPENAVTLPSMDNFLSQSTISDESEPPAHHHGAVFGEELVEELATSLAKALYMKRSDLDVNKKFVDMGVDSIIGVEWINAVNKQYGMSITATQIYDHPTIRAFAGFLEEELGKNGRGAGSATHKSSQPLSLDDVLLRVQQGSLKVEKAYQLIYQSSVRENENDER